MNAKQFLKTTLTTLLSTAALTLSHSTAQAIFCGDTLGPGGSHLLTNDLVGCNSSAGLTIVGPVSVNLNGHTISCANGSDTDGIAIVGTQAKVTNGTVTGCKTGVSVEGAGKHQVIQIAAQNNEYGLFVSSDKNRLVANTADNNFGWGITVAGARNSLIRNHVFGSALASGFFIHGLKNKLISNVSSSNVGNGFYIWSSAIQTTLSKNDAQWNVGSGIAVESNAVHKLLGNTAANNGNVDLSDSTPDCGSNVWKKNIYVTKDPACIQ